MFECLAPKSVSVLNFEGTDFVRRNPDSMFCHIRFTRPMVEGDNLELKVKLKPIETFVNVHSTLKVVIWNWTR